MSLPKIDLKVTRVSDKLRQEIKSPPILRKIDASPGIVEIYGPSGAGKTTALLQLVVSHLRSTQDSKALYVTTDRVFTTRRLQQLCKKTHSEAEFLDLTSRLFVAHLPDLESQDHFFRYTLSPSVLNHNISMIICDSVSANFRAAPRDTKTTSSLYFMAHVMHFLHAYYDIQMICANQISDSIAAATCFKPSLGLAWTNSISSRLLLDKAHIPGLRRIRIERSCYYDKEEYLAASTEMGLSIL